MEVLVLGSGAREHALAWRLARDEGVRRVRIAPGNGGTAAVAEPVPDLDITDPRAVARHATRERYASNYAKDSEPSRARRRSAKKK